MKTIIPVAPIFGLIGCLLSAGSDWLLALVTAGNGWLAASVLCHTYIGCVILFILSASRSHETIKLGNVLITFVFAMMTLIPICTIFGAAVKQWPLYSIDFGEFLRWFSIHVPYAIAKAGSGFFLLGYSWLANKELMGAATTALRTQGVAPIVDILQDDRAAA